MNVTTVLKTPTNLLAGNEGWRRRGEETDRQAKMERERERDGKGENERRGGRECMGSEWVRGGAIEGKMKEMGNKQHHFSCLLTGLPSTTHDDRRQNGHP